MNVGRLEVNVSRYTVGLGILGFLWLLLSIGFWEAFLRWREVSLWRETCARDGGKFAMDDAGMSCTYANGGRKSMIWRQPES